MTHSDATDSTTGPPVASPDPENRAWELMLFVAGQSPKSLMAYANLKKVCEQFLAGDYSLRIIDLAKEPAMAKVHSVVAVPTLIRQTPAPAKRVIGSLSNLERLISDLEIPVPDAPNNPIQ